MIFPTFWVFSPQFGFTALIWAAQNGRSLEVVRKLIKAKADPNLFSTNVC